MRRDDWKPKRWSFLCSKHFTSESFNRTGQNVQLYTTACPTIFDFPQRLVKIVKPSRNMVKKTKNIKHSVTPKKRRIDLTQNGDGRINTELRYEDGTVVRPRPRKKPTDLDIELYMECISEDLSPAQKEYAEGLMIQHLNALQLVREARKDPTIQIMTQGEVSIGRDTTMVSVLPKSRVAPAKSSKNNGISPVIKQATKSPIIDKNALNSAQSTLNDEVIEITDNPAEIKGTFHGPSLEKLKCLECGSFIKSLKHFRKYVECTMCLYSSCCQSAYANHMMLFHANQPLDVFSHVSSMKPLEMTHYCVCGFESRRGNALADHLSECGPGSYCTSSHQRQNSNGHSKGSGNGRKQTSSLDDILTSMKQKMPAGGDSVTSAIDDILCHTELTDEMAPSPSTLISNKRKQKIPRKLKNEIDNTENTSSSNAIGSHKGGAAPLTSDSFNDTDKNDVLETLLSLMDKVISLKNEDDENDEEIGEFSSSSLKVYPQKEAMNDLLESIVAICDQSITSDTVSQRDDTVGQRDDTVSQRDDTVGQRDNNINQSDSNLTQDTDTIHRDMTETSEVCSSEPIQKEIAEPMDVSELDVRLESANGNNAVDGNLNVRNEDEEEMITGHRN